MTDLRDDDDLAQLLRSTLATRGATVTEGPTWRGIDPAGPGERRGSRPGRRWLAPVAAAAAAAVVAGAIVASRQTHDDTVPPSSPTPSVTRKSVQPPSPSPTAVRPVVTTQCTTTTPPAWRSALQADDPYLAGAKSSFPIAERSDGAVLISREAANGSGDVLLQTRTGARRVLSVPATDLQPVTGGLYGDIAAVALFRRPVGNDAPQLHRIVIVYLRTNQQSLVPLGSKKSSTTGAVFTGSSIFWDERTSAHAGSVLSYDLATRTTAVRYTGALLGHLGTSAAGVYVVDPMSRSLKMVVPTPVPAAVQRQLAATSRFSVATDGTAWAWWDGRRHSFGWWQPGSAVRRVSSTLASPDGDDSVASVRVSEHYVFFQTPQPMVLDMRTGATATVPASVFTTAPGVVAALPQGASANVRVVDLQNLPGLTC